jgi:hypothetical protein
MIELSLNISKEFDAVDQLLIIYHILERNGKEIGRSIGYL